jgi:beta-xylosidase
MQNWKLALMFVGAGLSSVAVAAAAAETHQSPPPWISDQGDGTYRNPVLFADYSDLDVIRVGDDFYMTASSFNCVPGLPMLHSKDLVNWSLIGHAVRTLPARFDTVQHGNGIWAPCLRFRDGVFYIYYGDPDDGIFVVTTKDPAGEWSKPVLVKGGKGLIDPTPLWDDDGTVYLLHAWARSRAGTNNILTLHKLNPDGQGVADDGVVVVNANVLPGYRTLEGPKFYKRNGWYYIFAPAGGVREGWQSVFRSRNIYGPYEDRIVLEQGSTDINGPHQGSWVELESGENWFVHFQDRDAYGRLVHMNPVRWINDWPLMGFDFDGNGIGEPVTMYQKPNVGRTFPITTPVTGDEFNGSKLGLAWQWHANPKPGWGTLEARPGWLRLHAVPRPAAASNNLWLVPNQLLQKLPAPAFQATAKLEFTPRTDRDTVSLIVMGQDYAGLRLGRAGNDYTVAQITCTNAPQGGTEALQETAELPPGPVWLRVSVEPGAECSFSYSTDGTQFRTLGPPFRAREGRWIGAKFGLVCLGGGGHADIDWVRIEPSVRKEPVDNFPKIGAR